MTPAHTTDVTHGAPREKAEILAPALSSYGRGWETVVATADPLLAGIRRRHLLPGGRQRIPARSLRILQCRLSA